MTTFYKTAEKAREHDPNAEGQPVQRLYRLTTDALTFVWATAPQAAESLYARSLDVVATLLDSQRRQGLKGKISEFMAAAGVKSAEGKKLLAQLNAIMEEEDKIAADRRKEREKSNGNQPEQDAAPKPDDKELFDDPAEDMEDDAPSEEGETPNPVAEPEEDPHPEDEGKAEPDDESEGEWVNDDEEEDDQGVEVEF